MWMIYISLAVGLTAGMGFYSTQGPQPLMEDARVYQPSVQADQANQVSRYLRTMYLDNPSLFPRVPNSGQVVIPRNLVNRATTQGRIVPSNVSFLLLASGNIVPMYTPYDPTRGDGNTNNFNANTFNRVVQEDGSTPHISQRMQLPPERRSNIRPLP